MRFCFVSLVSQISILIILGGAIIRQVITSRAIASWVIIDWAMIS